MGRGERDGQTLAEAAEGVVRQLRGVRAVRVESDDAGGIRIVHVLGGPDRSAKVIAVDVVSALSCAPMGCFCSMASARSPSVRTMWPSLSSPSRDGKRRHWLVPQSSATIPA